MFPLGKELENSKELYKLKMGYRTASDGDKEERTVVD